MQDLNKFKNEMNLSGKNVYVGHRYVPKIFGEWDNSQLYEPLSIVQYQGNSFTSRQYVPTGVEITNEEYWASTGNYNAQIEFYRQDVSELSSEISTSRKTFPSLNERLESEYTDLKDKLNQTSILVDEFGAKGDGVTDDTEYLNLASEYAKENNVTLKLRKNGTYLVSNQGWVIGDNTTIDFNGAVVKMIANDFNTVGTQYQPLKIYKAKNVNIFNPKVVGDKEIKIKTPSENENNYDGYSGEWGHGITIISSHDVYIYNPDVSNCWGDGIFIDNERYQTYDGNQSKNINLLGTTKIKNCRRQGVSVISVDVLYIQNLVVNDIYGTNPSAAIDFEPNSTTVNKIRNAYVERLEAHNVKNAFIGYFNGGGVDATINQVMAYDIRDCIGFFHVQDMARLINENKFKVLNVSSNTINTNNLFRYNRSVIDRSPKISIGNVDIKKWVKNTSSSMNVLLLDNGNLIYEPENLAQGNFEIDRLNIDEIDNQDSNVYGVFFTPQQWWTDEQSRESFVSNVRIAMTENTVKSRILSIYSAKGQNYTNAQDTVLNVIGNKVKNDLSIESIQDSSTKQLPTEAEKRLIFGAYQGTLFYTVSGYLTVRSIGDYNVKIAIDFGLQNSGIQKVVVKLNDEIVSQYIINTNENFKNLFNVNELMKLKMGDVVNVTIFQNSGETVQIDNARVEMTKL